MKRLFKQKTSTYSESNLAIADSVSDDLRKIFKKYKSINSADLLTMIIIEANDLRMETIIDARYEKSKP